MTHPALYISRDPEYNWLSALEFGRVPDGQHPGCWRPVDEHFAYFVPRRKRHPRGFHVHHFDEFDPYAPEVEAIWDGPRFAAPLLGLDAATAGEVIVAARAHLGDEPTINRVYFGSATNTRGDEAIGFWRCCLEAGDGMAHFALGYTLFELGPPRTASNRIFCGQARMKQISLFFLYILPRRDARKNGTAWYGHFLS